MSGVICAAAIFIVIGLLMCFFGKRMLFPVVAVALFFSGMYLGINLFDSGSWQGWVAGAIIGVIFALLVKLLYRVLVFGVGLLFGFTLGVYLVGLIGAGAQAYALYIEIALALVVGIVAAIWSNALVIVCSAGAGSGAAALGIIFLVLNISELGSFAKSSFSDSLSGTVKYMLSDFAAGSVKALLPVAAALFALGLVVQFVVDARHKKNAKAAADGKSEKADEPVDSDAESAESAADELPASGADEKPAPTAEESESDADAGKKKTRGKKKPAEPAE